MHETCIALATQGYLAKAADTMFVVDQGKCAVSILEVQFLCMCETDATEKQVQAQCQKHCCPARLSASKKRRQQRCSWRWAAPAVDSQKAPIQFTLGLSCRRPKNTTTHQTVQSRALLLYEHTFRKCSNLGKRVQLSRPLSAVMDTRVIMQSAPSRLTKLKQSVRPCCQAQVQITGISHAEWVGPPYVPHRD